MNADSLMRKYKETMAKSVLGAGGVNPSVRQYNHTSSDQASVLIEGSHGCVSSSRG